MMGNSFSRRELMQGAAALGAAALIPESLSAQQVVRTASAQGAPLLGRGELLIRGVTVLSMDPAVPDLAAGDVHVREGTIVAVAPVIQAPAAQVLDGAGVICIPDSWILISICGTPCSASSSALTFRRSAISR
jgi:5-methylthioadenosine/S-adenosylhomocysteine deaminase